MLSATTRNPGAIHPDMLYSRKAFIITTGLSETRLREAKKRGIEPRRIWVGKRNWIRGKDAITFIERLAADEIQQMCRPEAEAE
jgi:hypothetical protein